MKTSETCGLFIAIVGSKIYLLHQTAEEFLVFNDAMESHISRSLQLKHALSPRESHHMLAQIFLSHLLLPLDDEENPVQYASYHVFLDKSAKHWGTHVRIVQQWMRDGDAMTRSTLTLCNARSKLCMTWLRIYWKTKKILFPRRITTLIVGSYFGLATAVKLIFRTKDVDVNVRDQQHHRSALSWAAESGFDDVAESLINHGRVGGGYFEIHRGQKIQIDAQDIRRITPLDYSVLNRNTAVVKLLVREGAQVIYWHRDWIVVISNAIGNGHPEK